MEKLHVVVVRPVERLFVLEADLTVAIVLQLVEKRIERSRRRCVRFLHKLLRIGLQIKEGSDRWMNFLRLSGYGQGQRKETGGESI